MTTGNVELDDNVQQSDRELRILARRKRVQERMQAAKEGHGGGKADKQKEGVHELSKGMHQVLESQRTIMRLLRETNNDVSVLSLQALKAEDQRRRNEVKVSHQLRQKLLNEAETSTRANATVAKGWANLYTIEVPEDLSDEIKNQKDQCLQIISKKDDLIKSIKQELKRKDDEYVKLLKKQAEDVEQTVTRMESQFQDMINTYDQELGEIESAFKQERSQLLQTNENQMQQIFNKRSRMEQEFTDKYLNLMEEYQKQLDIVQVQDAEEFNILRYRLENDIHSLEQHLEQMRAIYQLNTEKLEYNYRVLVERDHENQATINQQKRKISRLRDMLTSLKQRYNEYEQKHSDENAKLTDEYKRITEQYKDLQNKFRHFEQVDVRKYRQVWQMKEEEIKELVQQVLMADQVIHDQQLGWNWVAPADEVFMSPYDEDKAKKLGDNTQQEVDEEEEDDEATKEKKQQEELKLRMNLPENQRALQLVVNEAQFLIEPKSLAQIEQLPRDNQYMVKAHAIVTSMGVVDGATFDALLDALAQDSDVEIRANGMASDRIVEKREGSVLVHPDDVVRRLKAFIEAEKLTPAKTSAKSSSSPTRVPGISRRLAEREREFWSRLGNIISEKQNRVWGQLENQFEKYYDLLRGRSSSLASVEQLQRHNAELRALLNQYLSSTINEELQIPPTQLI